MEKKKINKGIVGVIIVLLLVIIGLSGFIMYDKVLKNKDVEISNKEESKTDKEEKDNDLDDDVDFECNYEKLRNAEELTENEKHNMITTDFSCIEYIIDPTDYEIKNIDEYRYSLKFFVQDGDPEPLYTILWKENNKWNNSEYFSSMEELKQNSDFICKISFSEDWMNDLLNKYTINNVEYTIITDKYDEKGAPIFIDKKFESSEYKTFLTDIFNTLDKKVNKTTLPEGIGFEMVSSIDIQYIDDKNVKHELSIIDASENRVAVLDWQLNEKGDKDSIKIASDYNLGENNLFDDVVLKYSK